MPFKLQWKHLTVIIAGGTIATVIYLINRWLGNSAAKSLPVSAFLFGITFFAFAILWEVKDTWRERWHSLQEQFPYLPSCELAEEFAVPTSGGGTLRGYLLSPKPTEQNGQDCVLLLHGYSDNQATLAYLEEILLQHGHCVATYDARGTGESRAVGNRNDFLAKIHEDLPRVVSFLREHPATQALPLKVVGFSMGASAALIQGVPDLQIRTVVGVAAAANHNENLPPTARFWSAQFWLRLRYRALGLQHNLPNEVNAQISPALFLSEERERYSPEEWGRLITGRVFLVHSSDDKSIKIDKLHANAEVLHVPPNQIFIVTRGGHMFLRGELLLASILIQILAA